MDVCHTCSRSVIEDASNDSDMKNLGDAEIIAFSRDYVNKIQNFGCGGKKLSPKMKRCVTDVMKDGKSESSAIAICKTSIEKASNDELDVNDVVLAYEANLVINPSPEDALANYRNVYGQVLALKKKPIKNLEDIDTNRDKLWPLNDKLWQAERDYKRSTDRNTDEADEDLLKVRLEARQMVEQFEKRGPGGHKPDGTGPHGRGDGPGKGKADGSGMDEKKKKKLEPGSLKGGKDQPTKAPGQKKAKPAGEGSRFKALKGKLGGQEGVKDPGALAAAIGRAKFGKKKFQKMAAKGK